MKSALSQLAVCDDKNSSSPRVLTGNEGKKKSLFFFSLQLFMDGVQAVRELLELRLYNQPQKGFF
jgi:hypothetical protein